MDKRVLGTIAAVALAGCGLPEAVGTCLGEALGSAIGRGLAIGLRENALDPGRPDEAVRRGGPTVEVSGPFDAGRLILSFDGPPQSATLPRGRPDAGNCKDGDFAFLRERSPDGGAYVRALNATVAVSSGSVTDAGTTTRLQVSSVTVALDDGGTRLLPGRDFDLVLP